MKEKETNITDNQVKRTYVNGFGLYNCFIPFEITHFNSVTLLDFLNDNLLKNGTELLEIDVV